MENVSRGLVELESLHLDLADGAGDDWSCLHDERWSGCQPLEGGVRATVHVHERLLAGRGVGCLAVSRGALLEYCYSGPLLVLSELLASGLLPLAGPHTGECRRNLVIRVCTDDQFCCQKLF